MCEALALLEEATQHSWWPEKVLGIYGHADCQYMILKGAVAVVGQAWRLQARSSCSGVLGSTELLRSRGTEAERSSELGTIKEVVLNVLRAINGYCFCKSLPGPCEDREVHVVSFFLVGIFIESLCYCAQLHVTSGLGCGAQSGRDVVGVHQALRRLEEFKEELKDITHFFLVRTQYVKEVKLGLDEASRPHTKYFNRVVQISKRYEQGKIVSQLVVFQADQVNSEQDGASYNPVLLAIACRAELANSGMATSGRQRRLRAAKRPVSPISTGTTPSKKLAVATSEPLLAGAHDDSVLHRSLSGSSGQVVTPRHSSLLRENTPTATGITTPNVHGSLPQDSLVEITPNTSGGLEPEKRDEDSMLPTLSLTVQEPEATPRYASTHQQDCSEVSALSSWHDKATATVAPECLLLQRRGTKWPSGSTDPASIGEFASRHGDDESVPQNMPSEHGDQCLGEDENFSAFEGLSDLIADDPAIALSLSEPELWSQLINDDALDPSSSLAEDPEIAREVNGEPIIFQRAPEIERFIEDGVAYPPYSRGDV